MSVDAKWRYRPLSRQLSRVMSLLRKKRQSGVESTSILVGIILSVANY
jgi:hypothetical protein